MAQQTPERYICLLSIKDQLTLKEVRNILQLRNIIFPVTTVLNEQRKDVVVFLAGMRRVQLGELPEDCSPGGDLLLGVVHVRQGLAVLVVVGDVREVLAARAVLGVGEPGVVRVQLRAVRQNLVCEPVQVADTTREPRDRVWWRGNIVIEKLKRPVVSL